MIKEKNKIYFYWWFAVVPLFCVIIDLLFSTIQPDSQYGYMTVNFDLSLINQLVYFSVWNALITSIWGWLNIAHHHNKKIAITASNNNTLTAVTAYNLFVFLVFGISMIIAVHNTIGFNTWYKILKSVLEHYITPPLLILFFFLVKRDKIKTKEYINKHSFYILIIPTIYLVFIIVRGIMIHNFAPTGNDYKGFIRFPYAELDPYLNPLYISFLLFIGVLFGIFLSAITLNYLYNVIHKNYNFNYSKNINSNTSPTNNRDIGFNKFKR